MFFLKFTSSNIKTGLTLPNNISNIVSIVYQQKFYRRNISNCCVILTDVTKYKKKCENYPEKNFMHFPFSRFLQDFSEKYKMSLINLQ